MPIVLRLGDKHLKKLDNRFDSVDRAGRFGRQLIANKARSSCVMDELEARKKLLQELDDATETDDDMQRHRTGGSVLGKYFSYGTLAAHRNREIKISVNVMYRTNPSGPGQIP